MKQAGRIKGGAACGNLGRGCVRFTRHVASASNGATRALQEQMDAALVQARVGHGPRGRGLMYAPPPPDADGTSSRGCEPPAPLVRVPLVAGLPLVVEGPEGLQAALLGEWQAHHCVHLPRPLEKLLLEGREHPPALRLTAWLLWAVRAAPDLAAYRRLVLLPASSGEAEGHAEGEGPGKGQPASCLRLGPSDVALLPPGLAKALAGVRAQVLSYSHELRRLGLDEGCDDAEVWWAFDMVTSRCFACTAVVPPSQVSTAASSPPSTASLALYVPWACLANHSATANTAFAADLQRREFTLLPRLRYNPLQPREELTLNYGPELDSGALLLRYGFVGEAGNPNDRLPRSSWPPGLAAAARRLGRQALCSAAEHLADRLAAEAASDTTSLALQATGGLRTGFNEGSGSIAGSAGGGSVGSSGSAAQQRRRVYSALATLLTAAAVGQATEAAAWTQAPLAQAAGGVSAASELDGARDEGLGNDGEATAGDCRAVAPRGRTAARWPCPSRCD